MPARRLLPLLLALTALAVSACGGGDSSSKDKAQAKTMVDFMKWALTDGQKYAKDLGYAPLPKEVVALELEALKRIKL